MSSKRIPTDYDLSSAQLNYSSSQGYEVKTPIVDWYIKNQKQSLLQCGHWEKFSDPRSTTYTKYLEVQKEKEVYLSGIYQFIEEKKYDQNLSMNWRSQLGGLLGVLRYPYHALQMVAAYIGQMAPSSKITIVGLFQAADELRLVQHLAYRLAQLKLIDNTLGKRSKEIWQNHPQWQPLRKAIEQLLVTYDWGESWIALNFCIKPQMDSVFLNQLGIYAQKRGDYLLGQIASSFEQDSNWQKQWSDSLMQILVQDHKENSAVVENWMSKWRDIANQSIVSLSDFLNACVDSNQDRIHLDKPCN